MRVAWLPRRDKGISIRHHHVALVLAARIVFTMSDVLDVIVGAETGKGRI